MPLSPEWSAWLAENVLLGVPRETLRETLAANAVPGVVADRAIDDVLRSPIVAAALPAARRVRRYELLTRLEREVARSSRRPSEIERRSDLSPDEFFEHYYAWGIPVVLTDGLAPWPATCRWTPASLKALCGDVEVEFTADRELDPLPDARHRLHVATATLGELCDRMELPAPTNDFYLIANNRLGERPGLAPLLEDLRPSHPLLDDARRDADALFWFGPAGTVTRLHYDTSHVLFCQVFGRKRVLLYPRFEVGLTEGLLEEVYCPVDPESPSDASRPPLADAVRLDVELRAGEALFIPVGCFHHVRALEPSLSVAFTRFRVPNGFGWYHPGRFG